MEVTRYDKLKESPEAYKRHLERNRAYRKAHADKQLEYNRRYRRQEEVRLRVNMRNKERYYGGGPHRERVARNSKNYRFSLQGYMRTKIRSAFVLIRSGAEGRYMKMMDIITGKKGCIKEIGKTHVSFIIGLQHFDLSNSVQLRKALHHTNLVGASIQELMIEPVSRPFVMETLPFVDTEDALFEAESFIRRCKQKVNYEG